MYSNEVGLTAVCDDCGSGKYRQSKESNGEGGFTEKTTDPTKCVDCPAGWTSEAGSTKCQSCEAGTFSNVQGHACDNCGEGKYRQSKESNGTEGLFTDKITDPTKCVDCPAGWTSEAGSTKCQSCEAGKYGNVVGEDCKNCDVGRYRTTATDAKACATCPSGYLQNEKGQTSWCVFICLPLLLLFKIVS